MRDPPYSGHATPRVNAHYLPVTNIYMTETWIDGAELWFPAEVELVETIRFIDRRYLGVITLRRGCEPQMFYASLMRRPLPEEDEEYIAPHWRAHTLPDPRRW